MAKHHKSLAPVEVEEELGSEEVEEEWRAACNPCPGLLIKIAIAHNHHGGHDGDDDKDGSIGLGASLVSTIHCSIVFVKTFEGQKSRLFGFT